MNRTSGFGITHSGTRSSTARQTLRRNTMVARTGVVEEIKGDTALIRDDETGELIEARII
jgi:hypothetical protein